MTPYRADVVIPCYREGAVLPHTVPVIRETFAELVADLDNGLTAYRLLLVDDGSDDATWPIIADFAARFADVVGLRLSRNFGHQSAMLAGLTHANADVVLTMDADLQDDIGAVAAMIAAYEGGAHLALGVRNDRSSDRALKSQPARAYYRLLSAMGIRIIADHADFRLISRNALAALLEYREVNLFLRGLIPQLGFPVTLVPYKRQPRLHGETKYTFAKMMQLAADGITSFSITPLRLISLLGAIIFGATMLLAAYVLYLKFAQSAIIVPGWASVVLPTLFLGGVQLLSIGVLGEYIGKIYLETKQRPRFIVQEETPPAKVG